MEDMLQVTVNGHCFIEDDLGNVHLDQTNAIHPQNMSRVFARALANESNYFINRIAFGNGGTTTDVAGRTIFKSPNDGQMPDTNTYDSRLYHETFSKIVNEGVTGSPNVMLGTDPGSADSTGIRVGGGSVPSSDTPSVPHVSGPGVRSVESGVVSKVVIYATLNKDEPISQTTMDSQGTISNTVEDPNTTFTFDEIGLYTSGSQMISTSGYHQCDVGNKTSEDIALKSGTNNKYVFGYKLSAAGPVIPVTFSIPGDVTYGQLCDSLNIGNKWGLTANPLNGHRITITDTTKDGIYRSIVGDQTNGYLTLMDSARTGTESYIEFVRYTTTELSDPTFVGYQHQDLFRNLNSPYGADIISIRPVLGIDAGYQNLPTSPVLECERLLTHLTFSPVRKAKNRRLNIRYTLTINVGRTPSNSRST